jgi:rhodanese-related sulfurtransferase
MVGSPISIDVDWRKKEQTLLLVLDQECPHCSANAEAYQRLLRQVPKASTYVVALLNTPVPESELFLGQLGLSVDEIRQVPLKQIGAFAVPALISVDNTGVVRGIWTGTLTEEAETQLLTRLNNIDTTNFTHPYEVFIDTSEFKRLQADEKSVTLVDVDERQQFQAAQIPKALNIPVDELEARANHELVRSTVIVVYCRGASNTTSRLAAKILYEMGFAKVSILKGGLDAWQRDNKG